MRTSSVTSGRQNEMYTTKACTRNGDQLIYPQGTVWSAVTSTRTSAQRQRGSDQNRDAGRSASVGDSELHPDDNNHPFVEMTARKQRRPATNGGQTQIVGNNSVARSQPRRSPFVAGNSTSSNSRRVSAAASYPPNTYVERSVFYIDNAAPTSSVSDIRDLASRMDVRVLSCYEMKPRRRPMDSVLAINRKAFRLCIHREDCGPLLDPQNITMSELFFKSSQAIATATAAAHAPDMGGLGSQWTGTL